MTYDQAHAQLPMSHEERLLLLSALVAWRSDRAARLKPSKFIDPKRIAEVVYGSQEKIENAKTRSGQHRLR